MSKFEVLVRQLTIHEHSNADALELAQVDGYRAVVAKGVYKTGDFALYIPEQAVLPPELIEELGLTGRLAGANQDRVKAVRLRGELSQGIVCRPEGLGALWLWYEAATQEELDEANSESIDYADQLGIIKWVPPVPTHMAGDAEPCTYLLPWTDIENIKSVPDMFNDGEWVSATEKIHGTCFQATYVSMDGDEEVDRLFVTSKGLGAKKLALIMNPDNLYWRAAIKNRIGAAALALADALGADKVGLFGEIYGYGVQDLDYGASVQRDDMLGFALFDVSYEIDGVVHWVDAGLRAAWENAGIINLPTVPQLYVGPYDYDKLRALAEGPETVSPEGGLHLREGLVVRPVMERTGPHGRVIAKFVSPAYLTRKDGTEYE